MHLLLIDQVSSEHTNQIVAMEASTYLGWFVATCDKTQWNIIKQQQAVEINDLNPSVNVAKCGPWQQEILSALGD